MSLNKYFQPKDAPISADDRISSFEYDSKNDRASVTQTKLAANAVGSVNIGSAAIDTTQIADEAITNDKLGPDAVTSAKIYPNTIGASDIANGAIGATQLAGSAVTTEKINASAVTSDKIATNGTIDMYSYKTYGTAGATGTIDTAVAGTIVVANGIIVSIT